MYARTIESDYTVGHTIYNGDNEVYHQKYSQFSHSCPNKF